MKTLTELKRNANTGKMKLELIERFGNYGIDIPKRLRGIRTVEKANSVALILVNDDNQKSELRLDSAKLIEYDGESLTIYEAGERELNDKETEVLEEIKNIYDKYKGTYNGGFWQVKEYCSKCPCPWMYGMKTIKGKLYNQCSGKVRDNSIKGKQILKYKVYMEN